MRSPEEIANDVERGRQILKKIAVLEAELKEIQGRLTADGADGEQVPLQDANREGRQYLARGHSGIVPVRFESDLIAASFDPDSVMHKEVLKAIGAEKLPKFFKRVDKFERIAQGGEEFRKVAREQLEADQFAALVKAVAQRDKLGIAKSKIVVAWNDFREEPTPSIPA